MDCVRVAKGISFGSRANSGEKKNSDLADVTAKPIRIWGGPRMASVIGVDPWGALRKLASVAKARPRPLGGISESMIAGIAMRLLDRGPDPVEETTPGAPAPIVDRDIETFARMALSADASALLVEIDRHLTRGLSVENLFVQLLAPAARRLGEGWETDELDFLEVTMGLWRLQEVLREVSARSPITSRSAFGSRVGLFSPFPGDQHSFGTAIVEECFARAGWTTDLLVEPTRADLLAAVGETYCDVLGLTVGNDCPIDRIHSLVAAVRSVSQNPDIKILLGGRVLTAEPGLAALAGADGTAATAADAVLLAESLIDVQRAAVAR